MKLKMTMRFGLLLLAAAGFAIPGQAQDFPTKPLRILVTGGQGGGPSLAVTLLAEQMGPLLGQSVLVDHKTGGGGVPAILDIMNARADGHTLIVLAADHWAIAPAMRTDLPYDTLRDFAPISLLYKGVQVIAVSSSFPAKDLKELIALARAKPGSLQYGAGQSGFTHQLIMESFKAAAGVDIQHIPYKASAQAVAGLLTGDVPMAIAGLSNTLSLAQAGKVRLLAVTSGTRSKQTPEIPTVAEAAGLPDFAFGSEGGLFARAGTPKPVIDKLLAAFRKAAVHPDVVARALKGGLTIEPSSPEEMADTVRADIKRFVQAVKAAGLGPKGAQSP